MMMFINVCLHYSCPKKEATVETKCCQQRLVSNIWSTASCCCMCWQLESVQLMPCHFLLLPEFFVVISFSFYLLLSLTSSFLFLPPNTPQHNSFNKSIVDGPHNFTWTTPLSLYLCGGVGVGTGRDKWDSAVLELIIVPRLCLTDAGDLNRTMQTYISPLAALCVCLHVCICERHAWHSFLAPAKV